MTIELTAEQRQYVERQVATGKYASESALVQQALEVLQRRDKRIAEVQAGVERGVADMEAGRYRTISTPAEAEALADEIKQRGRALRDKREQTAH
jgi:antitoxin ParD1/3/4